MYEITIPGEPRSKARARVVRGHAYTDKVTAAHEAMLAAAMRRHVPKPYASGVEIHVVFYRSTKRRIDIDNLLKAVLDAADGIFWADDSYVVRLSGQIELDPKAPRTEIRLGPATTSMPRGTHAFSTYTCKTCGVEFQKKRCPSQKPAVYCSQKCMQRPAATCEWCGASFMKNSAVQRFCTKTCAGHHAGKLKSEKAATRAANKPRCQACDAQLKRKTAVLCRPCWLRIGKKGVVKADLKANPLPEGSQLRLPS